MARILVVDDQKIPRTTVAAALREVGHEVLTAADGEGGLEAARAWGPDVIILDVYMPGMDGFQVVERLKEDPQTAPTPVIFLTAEPPTDDMIVRGLDLGAYDFLTKDCSRAELRARVGVMSRIKRSNDELSALARIADTLIQSLDPEDVSRRFVVQVQEVFRADAVLLIFHPGPEEPPLQSGTGLDAGDPLAEALARALLEELTEGRANPAVIDLRELRGPAGVFVRRNSLVCAAAVRLEHDDRPPVLLATFSTREEGFSRNSDAALLHLLARQASIALDNAVLHARTQAQAVRMEEQAEKLERAMSERSRFFASMSHELRTPINAVIGYNQLLQLGTYGALNDKQEEAVDNVNRSAQHLLELINDILDISKIEAGKLEVSAAPTDLCELVRDTVTSVRLQAEKKGLHLEVHGPDTAPAHTDAARVRQILLNLLSNAVKFTSTGGVTVQLCEMPERFEIRVTDTGPGIAPADLERIFEEFEQTRHTSPAAGTGLGLAISRRLAHLLGGSLEVESEVGEGATFRLSLPREGPPD